MSFFSIFDTLSGEAPSPSEQGAEAEEERSDMVDDEALEEYVDVGTTHTEEGSPCAENDDASSSMMSLEDHNVIVGFPPGTLMELMRATERQEDSSCGGTILSSAPSGAVMEPSPDSQSVWAISPHPRLAAGGALSISTTETMYDSVDGQYLVNDDSPDESPSESDPNNSNLETTEFLSVSNIDSSVLDDWSLDSPTSTPTNGSNSQNKPSGVHHDRASFVTVGKRLSSVPENRACCWYDNFDEEDWEEFRQAADTILEAVGPPRPNLVLPPEVPFETRSIPSSLSFDASKLLPRALVCPLCDDAIVAATTLSCGCPSSTVCIPCWDAYAVTTVKADDCKAPRNKAICPSCQETVDHSIPCHALDVAILSAIQNLSASTNSAMKQLQQSYYYRLNKWRLEVQRLLEQWSKEKESKREQLLAECIQQEEELFWKNRSKKRPKQQVSLANKNGIALLGEIALLIFAAAFGLRLRANSRR